MKYTVRIDDVAQLEIDECAVWMCDYDPDFMMAQFDRLERVFRDNLAQTPFTWNYFFITGAPYRACLFRVGRRTSYWIVYTIDEDAGQVNVLRFWNASRDPAGF